MNNEREQIERALLEKLELTQKAYRAGTGTRDAYLTALQTFNDFVVRGILAPKPSTKATTKSA